MVHAEENGVEYFYTTVQKGTPKENWLFVKMKTDGTPVLKITAPQEAGFKAPNEWRITAAVPGSDGYIFIANGYGDSRIFHLDGKGNYLRRPCQVSLRGDYAIVSELEGRVTVLDRDNAPVAFLGVNPDKKQWANYDLDPKTIGAAEFSAALGCF